MIIVDAFGPKIAKVKLSDYITEVLMQICNDATDPHNDKLVGYIREEMDIGQQLHDNQDVLKVLVGFANDYLLDVDSGMWNDVIASGTLPCYLEFNDAWYNNQLPGEHNPPHDHRYSADVVSVIYPKIELDTEHDMFYTNSKREKQLGQLNFLHGDTDKNGFGKKSISIQPEQGYMYIFPASLMHYTTPILGNSVRYSIGCNFTITNLARNMQNKLKKSQVPNKPKSKF
jgi:hypothetical protein